MRLFAIVLGLAVPLLASCGGDDETSGGQTSGGGGGQSVQVTATEFAFDPNEISVEAGEVSFELMNDGSAPHALEVEGNGVEESSDTIDGGESTTLDVELAEGTYEIYCPVGDHRERGMEGTLTVGAGGVGGGGSTDTAEDESDDEDSSGGGYG